MENNYNNVTKIPPYSIEAEQSILGSMLLNKIALDTAISQVKEKDFYDTRNKYIYRTIKQLYENNTNIDYVTVYNELTKKYGQKVEIALLLELTRILPASANIQYYINIIKEKTKLRTIINMCTDTLDTAYASNSNAEKLLDKLQANSIDIYNNDYKEEFISTKELTQSVKSYLLSTDTEIGYSTGFRTLDDIITIAKGQLITIAGRTSIGKTSFMLNIALNISKKTNVLIFSLEMNKQELSRKIGSLLSNISLSRIQNKKVDYYDRDRHNIETMIEKGNSLNCYINDSTHLTVPDIKALSRKTIMEIGDVGLICIDYLQLLTLDYDKKKWSKNDEVSYITRSLKIIAKELNIPIVILSQLNRSPDHRDDKRPKISDLRDSGCLTGDTIIVNPLTGERKTIIEILNTKKGNIFSLSKNLKLKQDSITNVFSSGKKPIYKIRTSTGKEIKASSNHKFLKLNGWTPLQELKVGDKIATIDNINILNIKNSNIVWDTIISIDKIGIEEVYDITTKETHNFIANDFIVHNSIEQDSDIVLLLYRDDYYNRKDYTEEYKVPFEVIVGKQRNGRTGTAKLTFNKMFTSFEEPEEDIEDE